MQAPASPQMHFGQSNSEYRSNPCSPHTHTKASPTTHRTAGLQPFPTAPGPEVSISLLLSLAPFIFRPHCSERSLPPPQSVLQQEHLPASCHNSCSSSTSSSEMSLFLSFFFFSLFSFLLLLLLLLLPADGPGGLSHRRERCKSQLAQGSWEKQSAPRAHPEELSLRSCRRERIHPFLDALTE